MPRSMLISRKRPQPTLLEGQSPAQSQGPMAATQQHHHQHHHHHHHQMSSHFFQQPVHHTQPITAPITTTATKPISFDNQTKLIQDKQQAKYPVDTGDYRAACHNHNQSIERRRRLDSERADLDNQHPSAIERSAGQMEPAQQPGQAAQASKKPNNPIDLATSHGCPFAGPAAYEHQNTGALEPPPPQETKNQNQVQSFLFHMLMALIQSGNANNQMHQLNESMLINDDGAPANRSSRQESAFTDQQQQQQQTSNNQILQNHTSSLIGRPAPPFNSPSFRAHIEQPSRQPRPRAQRAGRQLNRQSSKQPARKRAKRNRDNSSNKSGQLDSNQQHPSSISIANATTDFNSIVSDEPKLRLLINDLDLEQRRELQCRFAAASASGSVPNSTPTTTGSIEQRAQSISSASDNQMGQATSLQQLGFQHSLASFPMAGSLLGANPASLSNGRPMQCGQSMSELLKLDNDDDSRPSSSPSNDSTTSLLSSSSTLVHHANNSHQPAQASQTSKQLIGNFKPTTNQLENGDPQPIDSLHPPPPPSMKRSSSGSGMGDQYFHACPDCGKRYSTSSNLARHRQTHRDVNDKKAKKCPECDKIYVSMPAYSMHRKTHNQGCVCLQCGKKFSRPWLLQGHLRTHTGEKPFPCKICNKAFADKSNLRAHIQTHSSTKPFVCERCHKAFALKSYLCKHVESTCMRTSSSSSANTKPTTTTSQTNDNTNNSIIGHQHHDHKPIESQDSNQKEEPLNLKLERSSNQPSQRRARGSTRLSASSNQRSSSFKAGLDSRIVN